MQPFVRNEGAKLKHPVCRECLLTEQRIIALTSAIGSLAARPLPARLYLGEGVSRWGGKPAFALKGA